MNLYLLKVMICPTSTERRKKNNLNVIQYGSEVIKFYVMLCTIMFASQFCIGQECYRENRGVSRPSSRRACASHRRASGLTRNKRNG
jgi:hypothetical protein